LKISKGEPESVNRRRTDNKPFYHSFITPLHVIALGFSIYFCCLLMLCSRYYVFWLLHAILKYPFCWLHYASQVKMYFQSLNPILKPATIQMYYRCFLIILLSRERTLVIISSTQQIYWHENEICKS
jgi:hypothetical protein